jgi:hypothetical protein
MIDSIDNWHMRLEGLTVCLLSLAIVLPACGARPPDEFQGLADSNRDPPPITSFAGDDAGLPKKGNLMLSSSAFNNGDRIPKKYTGEGADLSPPLSWSGMPAGAKTFALFCDDPDAPSAKKPGPEPWVHWVIYNIPATATDLPEGIPRKPEPQNPAGAAQGRNSWPSDNVGFRGPMPPPGSGPHRYFFRLYALDSNLALKPAEATKKSVLAAMQGHILGTAELMGNYERK